MDDLRSEIRAAFEREQAGHPPAISLRHEVVRAAARQPRRGMNLQWLAVAATILIGVLVVVSLMSTRIAGRAPAPSQPVGDYGTPPAGVALFYVGDPKHPGWYVALDWKGEPRGTLKFAAAAPETTKLGQAPDGSELAVSGGKGGYTTFIDPVHKLIVSQDPSQLQSIQMWSEDSRQLCTLDFKTPNWEIGLASPGTAPSKLHTVALDPTIVRSGVIGVGFAACSPRNDRAILVRSVFGYASYEWVVQLSDGRILSQRKFDANMLSGIVASGDGSLIAESSAKADGQIAPAAPSTIVRRSSDGAVVATINPSYAVLALSGDNSVALITTTPWASGVRSNIGVLDLASGTVFESTENGELSSFLVEPGAKAFALLWKEVGDQSAHPRVRVYLIGTAASDGFLPYQYLQP